MGVIESWSSLQDRGDSRWRPFALTALLLLGAVLLARVVSFRPAVINPDESIFVLSAREVLNGYLPYEHLFDNKPVGSAFLLAAAFRLIGVSIFSVRLVGALCVWASAVLTAMLGESGGLSRLQAFCCGLLYVAFASTMGGFATLTEIILMPFTVLAVLLLHRTLRVESFATRLLLFAAGGLACGCAIIVKIVPVVPGFMVAGLILVTLLVQRRSTLAAAAAHGAVFALSSALPILLAAALYARAGELPMFLFANFGFGGAYAEIHPGAKMIAQRLATTVDSLWPLLALSAVAGGVLAAAWRRDRQVPYLLLLAFVWLLGELVAAVASLHFYPHYFLTAVPPLAIMSAFGIRALVAWMGVAEAPGRAIALLSVAAAIIPAERAQVDLLRDVNANQDQPRRIALAIEQANHGKPPTLFVTNYDLAVLYSLTGAPLPPTRFVITNFLFTNQSAIIRGNPPGEVATVLASRPGFIVTDDGDSLPAWATAQLAAALRQGYHVIYRVNGVTVYQAEAESRRRSPP